MKKDVRSIGRRGRARTHSAPRSIQSADFAYPTWPAEIAPGYDYVYYVYAMQLRYNATCASAAA